MDPETGYYYYGARYYNPMTSVWLSVDPLADKYPSLTPYAFVANNPIMLIDPDGMRIFVKGDFADKFLGLINGLPSNLSFSRNSESGKLSFTYTDGKSKEDLNLFENIMVKGINSERDITINTVENDGNVLFDADIRDGGDGQVDVGDFEILKDMPAVQKAFIGHFIGERLSGEKSFRKAHKEGIKIETDILRETYPDLYARPANIIRDEIPGRTDGKSDFFLMFDWGSYEKSPSPYGLWLRYDKSNGRSPNVNNPSGAIFTGE